MKNKITCLLASTALFGATANAEIVLGDSLSAYGYIDMALTDGEGDANTDTTVAEFELGLSFAPAESKWSAVAELSFDSGTSITSTSESVSASTSASTSASATTYDVLLDEYTTTTATSTATTTETATTTASSADDSSAEFEVVTISYQYSDSLSFSFGNMDTYQGFETADATGLYQYSYAGASGINGGYLYSALYAVGASADYSAGDFDIGVWVGDADGNDATSSFEYYVGYNGIENLSLNVVYADDPGYETTNIWATFDYGNFTFAVESVDTEIAGVDFLDIQTALVYYAMGDAGITVRVTDGEYGTQDFEKLTISPSYAFSDNVFGLVEFSTEELGTNGDQDSLAVELIYSF